ncbi:hypothetical protein OMW55_06215 [Sphingomonas sp. BN140010]|uniref:DUF1837 domain-containing protein n=1 Tax=Sphingomonas arvum TaxID=2992113 RepID=A0ABT3JEA3_9SPHN|nr:hypothetical protein [Sphingomonas sp. BN140010]MCW3797398.1 hypothetical protein [Sphingomonas sp. BN140010]
MPIEFDDHDCGEVCSLAAWRVVDSDTFAKTLAWLYLRKPRHALNIIQALQPGEANFPGNEFDAALALLSYRTDDLRAELESGDLQVKRKAENTLSKRIEQRDGLLFQHVSWLAAYLRNPGAHLSPPHVRKADKGFDGVLVRFRDDAASVSAVILCEDKATTNPRNLVTQSIWPEIEDIIDGRKDLEILDYVTAILDKIHGLDPELALRDLSWDKVRRFRVAVTVPEAQARDGTFAHIFEGFDEVAPHHPETRIGEIMSLPDVRGFLDDLAGEVRAKIDAMRAELDV